MNLNNLQLSAYELDLYGYKHREIAKILNEEIVKAYGNIKFRLTEPQVTLMVDAEDIQTGLSSQASINNRKPYMIPMVTINHGNGYNNKRNTKKVSQTNLVKTIALMKRMNMPVYKMTTKFEEAK